MPQIESGPIDQFNGVTYRVDTPDGLMFVIIMEDAQYKPCGINIHIGKSGTAVSAWANAVARVCSLALDHGTSIPELISELSGNNTDKNRRSGEIYIRSGVAGLAYALIQYLREGVHGPKRTRLANRGGSKIRKADVRDLEG